jgi:hypothetical protein
MKLKNTLSILFAISALFPMAAQTQVIHYSWPNAVCASMLNCLDGCSACNVPDQVQPGFFGTNVAWLGVDVCPYPLSVGNNAVFTSGWGLQPEASKRVLVSGIGTTELRIDSIVIRHASYSGPVRLKVRWTNDMAAPMVDLADVAITYDLGETVLTNVGIITIPEGMQFATFQLELTPYDGDLSGSWVLDDVRVVASPNTGGSAVGIIERGPVATDALGVTYDVLGRPVSGTLQAAGAYTGAVRRVVVQ